MRYKHTMTGPKTFEEWVEVYEERDIGTKYVLSPGERIVFDPMYGFFTYCLDAESRCILVPKMCGDGRHWRSLVLKLAKGTRHLGIKGVLFCTKRNPAAFLRVLGGTLERMEHIYDFKTGRSRTLWYIFVTWGNVKIKPMKGEDEVR